MRLPSPHDEDFKPYLVRAENLRRSMRPPEWIPPEYPALALLHAALVHLQALNRAECAELLRSVAAQLDKTEW